MLRRNKPNSSSLLHYNRDKTHVFFFLVISLFFFSLVLPFNNVDNIIECKFPKQQYHAFAQTSNTDITANDFLTYENATYGVKISYPSDWTYYGTAESGGFIDIVTFQAPFEGRTDLSSALFIVSRDTLPSDKSMSLKDYVDIIIDNNRLSDPNYKVVESSTDGSISLVGRPAYRIMSTTILDGIPYQTQEIGSIIGNEVYLVTYDAEEAEFSKYQPVAQDMINSFQINVSAGGEADSSDTIPGNITFGRNATIDSSNITDTTTTARSRPRG